MDRFHIQEAFMVLKPYCDALMRQPDINNAQNVANTVSGLSEKVVQDLFEYISLPITSHLCNEELSKNIKEELVKTLQSTILKARIKRLEHFTKLYSSLLIQIYDKSQPTLVISGHEELKSAVLLCIIALVHSSFTDVIESLYTKKNAPRIGQGILLSITIARTEKSRTLRLNAIETVMALCQVDDTSDQTDIILQDQVADIITLYLPGVVSGLQEIAMGNETQGHKVTMLALRAWGRIISLVMKDKDEDDVPSLEILNSKQNNQPINIDKLLKSGVRSADWYEAAALKLKVLIQELDTLKNHSHYKVRKELAENIYLLLKTCSRNMKPNVMLLIEYLISLSEDDVPEVKQEAGTALETVSSCYMKSKDMRPLVELLEENFYNLLTRLPQVIRRSDDHEQLATLNQVAGYLKLLGPQRLPHIMVSAPYIRRLILALVYVLEIDSSDVSLLETVHIKDLDDSAYTYGSPLWRRLKFIQNKSCQEKLQMVARFLGQFGDLRVLVDTILGLIPDSPQHRKELILLLNWITDVSMADEAVLPLYKEIIEFYINNELWYPTLEVTEDVPLCAARSNVLQCCLLVEGLGLIALNLKTFFESFLLKTLYLLIERAGSGHSLISFVGSQALSNVANSQGFNTVGDLLRVNVDYFSYHVTIKLRRVERNPGVLDVVGVVMKYSTMDVLPCLKEIVEDVLLQLNKSFQQKNSYAFLKVFYTFIMCIKQLSNPKTTNDIEEKCKEGTSQAELVILAVLEYYDAKKIEETIDDEPEETEDERVTSFDQITRECTNDSVPLSEDDDSKKPKVPLYIKMVEDVMNRCLHFLPSKDIQKSLMAMLTLQEGLYVLSEWEDQLLPIVHLIWHPLVDRFQVENLLIINRAWQLLNVLAQVSKDFIRSRTLKQVFPALRKFLRDSAKKSYNKGFHDAYKFTQIYKLQVELLSTLSKLAIDLKLREREIWDILTITEPYLSCHQNPVLQSACLKLYTEICDYNGDLTLVKCLSIWNSKIAKIPTDASFRMEHLNINESASGKEYYKNIQTILNTIQEKSMAVKT